MAEVTCTSRQLTCSDQVAPNSCGHIRYKAPPGKRHLETHVLSVSVSFRLRGPGGRGALEHTMHTDLSHLVTASGYFPPFHYQHCCRAGIVPTR